MSSRGSSPQPSFEDATTTPRIVTYQIVFEKTIQVDGVRSHDGCGPSFDPNTQDPWEYIVNLSKKSFIENEYIQKDDGGSITITDYGKKTLESSYGKFLEPSASEMLKKELKNGIERVHPDGALARAIGLLDIVLGKVDESSISTARSKFRTVIDLGTSTTAENREAAIKDFIENGLIASALETARHLEPGKLGSHQGSTSTCTVQ